ncbi:hypothetical protein OAG71_02405 [bacterium]|nr:hypothetical protein [bacterium]
MSFFSFQDIITATTGILILLALVLALSVIIQGAESDVEVPPQATNQQIAYHAGLVSEVDSLRKQTKEVALETANLSSATPSDLKDRISSTNLAIAGLNTSIRNNKLKLRFEKQLLEDLQNDSTAEETKAELEQVELSIKETNVELNKLKTENRVVYNFRDTTRTPWLVQVADSEILAARVGSREKPKSFTSAYAFNQFADSVPNSQRYFVLIVRPSGIGNLDTIKAFLIRENLDVGVELIGESTKAIDSEKGLNF